MTADPGELDIILNNLVSNAVKYNRDNGRVDIDISAGDEQVVLKVSDTGIGLSPEEAGRLFNVSSASRTTRQEHPRQRSRPLHREKARPLYGGEISVSSEADKGSTFTVQLDRVPRTEFPVPRSGIPQHTSFLHPSPGCGGKVSYGRHL